MPSIYIYDSSQWGICGWKYDKTIEVFSIADMVTKVSKVLDNGRELNSLIFGGKAGSVYQSIGANGLDDATGDKSFQLDDEGNLKGGGGRYLHLLKGRIKQVSLYNLKEDSSYVSLLIAMGKELGTGVSLVTENGLLKYYDDNSEPARRITNEATVDREALKKRLGEYTAG